MLALIDGDIVTYNVGFASEKNGVEPLENCLHSVKLLLMKILKETGASDYKIYLTGQNNFRETVAVTQPYKGNRDPNHKPAHYQAIKRYLINTWQAEVINGMEADDAMGMSQTQDTIICSLDKDMLMIPGWHYNWRKDTKKFVTDAEAIRHFWFQMLTGDRTDNIKGVPKIGEKTANKLLDATAPSDYAEMVVEQYYLGYYKYHFNKDMETFLAQIDDIIYEHERLLWIQRSFSHKSLLPSWLKV